MKKSRMLKTLKVGGLNYQIIYPYVFETNAVLLGLHEGDQARIKVTKRFLNLERHWCKITETLLHEILHAVDHVYAGNILIEDEVFILSNYLYQIVRDNDLNIKKSILPESVRIGAFDYAVSTYEFCDDSNSAATVEHETLKFMISDRDANGNDYHSGIKMTNFMYLLTCCICELSTIPRGFMYGEKTGNGVSNHQAFAAGLYQVFVDNDLEKLIKSDGEIK